MKINFFTIVLNGMPFIKHHIEIFNKLNVPWHWHIIEGVADLKKDTAWSVKLGGKIDNSFHNEGLSIDGTTEYLNSLKEKFPDRITIYRKQRGEFWNGKVEMCNAPLANINEECLLWQIDVDEIWKPWMIDKLYNMFLLRPEKFSAWFICRYYVGRDLVITSKNTYGNKLDYEWLRVWRYIPGMYWYAHEPPTLVIENNERLIDIGKVNPFTHSETEAEGIIFDHYAYVNEKQLEFKEKYYGYKNARKCWEELNNNREFPVFLKKYFHWVNDNAIVDKIYKFKSSKNILIVRTDSIGDHVIFSAGLKYLREIFSEYKIYLLTQTHIKELLDKCPYIDEIIPFDRIKAITSMSYLNQIMEFLKSKNFDISIYPVYSREALGDILTQKCNAKYKISINGNYERISKIVRENFDKDYDYLIDISDSLNELEKNREIIKNLCKMFGIKINLSNFMPDVWIDEEDIKKVDQLLKENNIEKKEFIIISPTALIPIRNWQKNKWKNVIEFLKDHKIIFTGARGDIPYINSLLKDFDQDNIKNFAGKLNLRELAYLFSLAKFSITLESAPSHISTAVGTPNIVILGGGHFGRFIPYSDLQIPVYRKMDCFNCNWNCKYSQIKCIENVQPEDVIEKIKILSQENIL